ncbi:MAG TPA: FAD-dependent oxidoreductase [Acidimicrobiales bacterium]|jgi:protoporphyrinogen oxidase
MTAPSAAPRIAVVGGGLLGMTLAHRLRGEQPNASITVFESAPRAGGLASAWTVGTVTWDRFYHVTLASDSATRRLLRELDLEDEVSWETTRTGCWADGRITPLGTPVEFLRSPVLGPLGKARLAMTIGRGSTTRRWQRLEDTPVADWLTRWSGRATFRRFWLPLLRSKLGDGWSRSNAAFIWATIQRLSAARRAGLGDERFGYVRGKDGQPGGYARTLEALGGLLAREDIDLRCNAKVESVERDGSSTAGALTVRTADGVETFDDVVVTVAPPVAAKLCPALNDTERDALAAIPYQGVVCTSLVLRRPLAGYYLTYLVDDVPITTVIEMSSLVDPVEYAGHTLVYIPQYVSSDAPILDSTDEEIAEAARRGLQAVHPGVTNDDIVATRTARARYVFPLPVLGYSRTVPSIETSVPGLHLVCSAQIVNGTLNANETITLADTAAPKVAGALHSSGVRVR